MPENFSLLVSSVHELLNTWTSALIVFLFTSSVLILCQTLLENATLYGMNTRTIIFMIWLFSLIVLIVKGINAVMKRYRQKVRTKETLQNALKFIISLPPAERSVLQYIYHNASGAVYLPYDNAAVLHLWHNGALRRLANVIFTRKDTGCFLYEILPQLRMVIASNYALLNWDTAPLQSEMDKYQ